jgi:adenylosuccinate synthase
MISNRVQILLEHHILIDKLEEQRLADRAFGSTKSGIAPFYAEKYSKTGLQLWELYDINLKERLKQIYDKINNIIKSTYNADKIDYVKVYDKLSQLSQKILPYVKDTTKVLKEAIKQNKHILLEGQLGSLKDIDHGIYPYVTSSSTLAGYACTGAGISPIDISEILAVTKAYSSAVGEGPFVSEIFGNEADQLRARGGDAGEYGTTTNRPRRVGYFDAIASKYGVNIQGANKIAITCLDVLAYMDKIPVCVAYDIEGNKTLDFPTTNLLYKAKPVYEYLQGFGNIRDVTDYNDLPNAAKEYVAFIEDFIGVKVSLISTGPSRDAIIEI